MVSSIYTVHKSTNKLTTWSGSISISNTSEMIFQSTSLDSIQQVQGEITGIDAKASWHDSSDT